MKPELEERLDPPTIAALATLVRVNVRPATPEQMRRGWAALSTRLSSHEGRKWGQYRVLFAGAMLGVVAVAVFWLVSWWRLPGQTTAPVGAIAYKIEGGSLSDGGFLRESGSKGVKLMFAEGSEFVLMPGTRSRLRNVDGAGARIAIESGAASFQITPRSGARWLVDVGPFLVTVQGTVFSVSWDAAAERFELRLQHGQVSVNGPIAGGSIPLRAGQRLVVNLPKEEILITEQKPEEIWPGSPSATAAVTTADLPIEAGSPKEKTERGGLKENPVRDSSAPNAATAAGKISGRRAWAEAAAAGRWDQILADVDQMGAKASLAEVTSEELFILADAARYRGRAGLARDALQAERTRFPGSARALDAVFLLGRLEESNSGNARRAIALYDEYLSRAPTGTYASEALGRKMIAASSLEGAARAKPIAEEYLLRFPRGTYAGAARALLKKP